MTIHKIDGIEPEKTLCGILSNDCDDSTYYSGTTTCINCSYVEGTRQRDWLAVAKMVSTMSPNSRKSIGLKLQRTFAGWRSK